MKHHWAISISALLIVFLLAFSGVSAEQFEFVGSSSIVVPACGVGQQQLFIVNSGSSVIRPQFVVASRFSDWVTIISQNQLIAPGETVPVDVFIQAPCGSAGTYTLDIDVVGVSIPQRLSQTLVVSNPNNIELVVSGSSITTCPCTLERVPYVLKNTGSHIETYVFDFIGSPQSWYSSIPQRVTLSPGEQIQSIVHFQSACDVFGDLSAELQVSAVGSGWSATVPFDTTVEACYEFSLIVPDVVEVCQDIPSSFEVAVRNIAALPNGYTFSVDEQWGWIAAPFVELLPNQTGVTEVFVDAQGPIADNLTISAFTSVGNLAATARVPVRSSSCIDVSIQAPASLDVCEKISEQIPVVIRNDGNQSAVFDVFIEDRRGTLFSSNVTIGAQDSIEMLAEWEPDRVGEHVIDVRVVHSLHERIRADHQITVTVDRLDSCYAISVEPTSIVFNVSEQSHFLTLINTGSRDGVFSLVIDDPFDLDVGEVSLDVGENITVTLLGDLPDEDQRYRVTLTPSVMGHSLRSTVLVVDVGSPRDTFVFILLLVGVLLLLVILLLLFLVFGYSRSENGQTGTHSDDSAQKEDVVLVQETSSVVKQSTKEPLSQDTKKDGVNIDEDVKVSRAQVLESVDEPVSDSQRSSVFWRVLLWLLLLVLLLICLGVIVLVLWAPESSDEDSCGYWCRLGEWWSQVTQPSQVDDIPDLDDEPLNGNGELPDDEYLNDEIFDPGAEALAEYERVQREGLAGSFSYQVLFMNTEHTLNLSLYFTDPDGDPITYNYFPMDNISVFIDGDGIATFTPDRGFFGIRNTSIIAQDDRGGVTRSPVMTVIVLPDEQEEQDSYMVFWIVAFSILLLLIVLIVFMYRST